MPESWKRTCLLVGTLAGLFSCTANGDPNHGLDLGSGGRGAPRPAAFALQSDTCPVSSSVFVESLRRVIDVTARSTGDCVCGLLSVGAQDCRRVVCDVFLPSEFVGGRCPFQTTSPGVSTPPSTGVSRPPSTRVCPAPASLFTDSIRREINATASDGCLCNLLGLPWETCLKTACDLFLPSEFVAGRCPSQAPPSQPPPSQPPPSQPPLVDPVRQVIDNHRGALGRLSLSGVLSAAMANSGVRTAGSRVYQELFDTFASRRNGLFSNVIHCGSATTGGRPSLNGFPIDCDRLEMRLVDDLDDWFPVAAVNRLDLAPENGAHCGQQRLIFALDVPPRAVQPPAGNGRAFIILEPVIPNPDPACGVAACRPLAEFWDKLARMRPQARAAELERAFVTGHPDLEEAGFGPFVNAAALTFGTGQIRTNTFGSVPWTLREFKLLRFGAEVTVVAVPVAESPHGSLWNDRETSTDLGRVCRQSFVSAVGNLLVPQAQMSFPVDPGCNDAESRNDNLSEDYAAHLRQGSGSFNALLADALGRSGLSPADIANRARFAGSCIGCHQESNGASLGRGQVASSSNGFVHVSEATERCPEGGNDCFTLSPMLRDVFLPHRIDVHRDMIARRASCGGGGDVVWPGLDVAGWPTSAADVAALVEAEAAARAGLTGNTLGGQAASTSH